MALSLSNLVLPLPRSPCIIPYCCSRPTLCCSFQAVAIPLSGVLFPSSPIASRSIFTVAIEISICIVDHTAGHLSPPGCDTHCLCCLVSQPSHSCSMPCGLIGNAAIDHDAIRCYSVLAAQASRPDDSCNHASIKATTPTPRWWPGGPHVHCPDHGGQQSFPCLSILIHRR